MAVYLKPAISPVRPYERAMKVQSFLSSIAYFLSAYSWVFTRNNVQGLDDTGIYSNSTKALRTGLGDVIALPIYVLEQTRTFNFIADQFGDRKKYRKLRMWGFILLGTILVIGSAILTAFLAKWQSARGGWFSKMMENKSIKSLVEFSNSLIFVTGFVLIAVSLGQLLSKSLTLTSLSSSEEVRAVRKRKFMLLALAILLIGAQFGIDCLLFSKYFKAYDAINQRFVPIASSNTGLGFTLVAALSGLATVIGLFVVASKIIKAISGNLSTWKWSSKHYYVLSSESVYSKEFFYEPDKKFLGRFGRKTVVIPAIVVAMGFGLSILAVGFYAMEKGTGLFVKIAGGNPMIGGALKNLFFSACFAVFAAIMLDANQWIQKLIKIASEESKERIRTKIGGGYHGYQKEVADEYCPKLRTAGGIGLTTLGIASAGAPIAIFTLCGGLDLLVKMAISIGFCCLTMCLVGQGKVLVDSAFQISSLKEEEKSKGSYLA